MLFARFNNLEILIMAIPVFAVLYWLTPQSYPRLRTAWGALAVMGLAFAMLLAGILVVGR